MFKFTQHIRNTNFERGGLIVRLTHWLGSKILPDSLYMKSDLPSFVCGCQWGSWWGRWRGRDTFFPLGILYSSSLPPGCNTQRYTGWQYFHCIHSQQGKCYSQSPEKKDSNLLFNAFIWLEHNLPLQSPFTAKKNNLVKNISPSILMILVNTYRGTVISCSTAGGWPCVTWLTSGASCTGSLSCGGVGATRTWSWGNIISTAGESGWTLGTWCSLYDKTLMHIQYTEIKEYCQFHTVMTINF